MGETERKEKERAGWKKVRNFAIVCLAVLIVDVIIAILFWEWDGVWYIIFGTFTAVWIYKRYLERKMDGRL